jgi:Protein of unknown function (DUF1214)
MGDKHLFHPNDLKRYSLGTKNKNLKRNVDGSLTLYAGAKSPGAEKETNRRRVDISRSTSAPIGARSHAILSFVQKIVGTHISNAYVAGACRVMVEGDSRVSNAGGRFLDR